MTFLSMTALFRIFGTIVNFFWQKEDSMDVWQKVDKMDDSVEAHSFTSLPLAFFSLLPQASSFDLAARIAAVVISALVLFAGK